MTFNSQGIQKSFKELIAAFPNSTSESEPRITETLISSI